MFTKRYLEQSHTSTMELFHILKSAQFDRIAFRFHFLHNSHFREKAYSWENLGEKVFC